MKKIVLGFVLAISFFGVSQAVLAQEGATPEPKKAVLGIIPMPDAEADGSCGVAYLRHKIGMDVVNGIEDETTKDKALQNVKTSHKEYLKELDLGTKIKGGCVQLSDIPSIVIHLIDLATKLAGTIAVIFLLYAGFQMIVSGVTDDREAAKNTIKYALTGLIVSFLAWVIVNLVQVQLTI